MSNGLNSYHTLLIADQRRNVREFLQREMSQSGYRVLTAKNGQEITFHLKSEPAIDLLIIDPNLPDVNDWAIFNTIEHQAPAMPVIVHTYVSDYTKHTITLGSFIFVEKRGNSIDSLKKIAAEVLDKSDSEKERMAGAFGKHKPQPAVSSLKKKTPGTKERRS